MIKFNNILITICECILDENSSVYNKIYRFFIYKLNLVIYFEAVRIYKLLIRFKVFKFDSWVRFLGLQFELDQCSQFKMKHLRTINLNKDLLSKN